jgi:hypothetical protein
MQSLLTDKRSTCEHKILVKYEHIWSNSIDSVINSHNYHNFYIKENMHIIKFIVEYMRIILVIIVENEYNPSKYVK